MKVASVVFSLVLFAFAYVRSQELEVAKPCEPEACKLPNCRCSSTSIPGGLAERDTPQFIVLTFNDAVNAVNIDTYRTFLYNRKNRNNCTAGATFFINHQYTNYSIVNELYNNGFEIALHSITRNSNRDYWRDASLETLLKEFADQRLQMSHFASIPLSSINGVRSPSLQLAGDATFQMIASAQLRYDLTWGTSVYTRPGLWPYTLHYASIQDCYVPPCPTAAIPGPWVLPIVQWIDLGGLPCSFVDGCIYVPESDDEQGWFQFILNNFERHYLSNRAPFGFHVSAAYLNGNLGLSRAFIRFLDMLNNLNDVFMVKANEVIDWVQNPVPIDEYVKQSCQTNLAADCRQTDCGPYETENIFEQIRIGICSSCPSNYPWLDNPLGE